MEGIMELEEEEERWRGETKMPRRPEYSTGGLNYNTRQYIIPFLNTCLLGSWHQLASGIASSLNLVAAYICQKWPVNVPCFL
jgi:hypothetical protein